MRTRDFVQICNKLSLVCKLMAKNKENTKKQSQWLLKESKRFTELGRIYAKLNKRKKQKKNGKNKRYL